MYGVHANLFVAGGESKRVVIHLDDCSSYKQMARKGKSKSLYSFNSSADTFRDALKIANEYALNWHAPIHLCKKCFKGQKTIDL